MPFQSRAQQKFLFAKKPEIAKRWSKEYHNQGNLPAIKRKLSKYTIKKHEYR